MKIFKNALLFLNVFLTGNSIFAQTVTIPIETDNVAIALQTDAQKHLKIVHFGKPLQNKAEYEMTAAIFDRKEEGSNNNNLAFSVAGINSNTVEPAIAVVHTDGNNSIDLIYQNHTINNTNDGAVLTTVTLKDPVYPVTVKLFYKAWKNEDVIEQWSSIQHQEKGNLQLNKYASANLYFFNRDYFLTSYNGVWARELQPEHTQLKQGMHTIQSRLGTRENLQSSQNFMLAFDQKATENSGTVMLGQLAWHGNYAIQFETDAYQNLHLVAGINPYQSVYELRPDEEFVTPRFIYTLSHEGMGKGARNLHNWMRNHNLLDGKGERLTLLNNWEATYFDFDQEKLTGLFSGAREIGVDMFLLDDGWFGNKYPRNSDNAGLGDWQANKKKLPDGVPYLVQEAGKQGVKFGIWIEPEMVNPKSELYEKKLDWVIREEKRPEILFRNQMVLDLTNPEVQDFVFGVVDQLFIQNPSLAFIKWDCNAPVFNGHSKYLEKKKLPQSHLYVAYARGLENVLKRVRAKYPKVPMMLCSGGGGRTDYELLKYFTEFWPSDNTDPLERVFMQWDYSYFYPSLAVCNHVTEWSNKPLKYRIDVASMGKMGFDIDVKKLKAEELEFCKQAIKSYNGFKNIVWQGDMYRLKSPYETNMASMMYVSTDKNKAIMFNYLSDWRYIFTATQSPVRLQGLDANKKYRITELNLPAGQQSPIDSNKVYSGDFLMNAGFNPFVNLNRTSVVLSIEAI
ncbi:MAG TPA: alpha-galactosidase [Niabella sp.]|nr:alpha-galactosidase [Niabella sp.]